MTMNRALKAELIRLHGTQFEAARVMGVHESRLSQIIRGNVKPNLVERASLEKLLGKSMAKRLLEEGSNSND